MGESINNVENSYIIEQIKPYLINQDLTKIYVINNYNLNEEHGVIPSLKFETDTDLNMNYTKLEPVKTISLFKTITRLNILQEYPLLTPLTTTGLQTLTISTSSNFVSSSVNPELRTTENYNIIVSLPTQSTTQLINSNLNQIKEIYLNDNIPIISNNIFDIFNHTLINFPKNCEIVFNDSLGTNPNLRIWCYHHNSSLLTNAGIEESKIVCI